MRKSLPVWKCRFIAFSISSMRRSFMHHYRELLVFTTLLLAMSLVIPAQQSSGKTSTTITLAVDASEAPRKILHARLKIPVSPGTVALCYPKWIPGEHMPSGPVTDLAGLKFTASGQTLTWRHDDVD